MPTTRSECEYPLMHDINKTSPSDDIHTTPHALFMYACILIVLMSNSPKICKISFGLE